MDSILQLDTALFFFIHQDLKTAFGDWLMPLVTNKIHWIPLYLGLLGWIFLRYRHRVWPFFLACLLCVAIADTTSSKLIKKNIQRLRPCNDVHINANIDVLTHCGSGYSFTSSHATNHFAVGSFWFFTLTFISKRWRWWCLAWAGLIAVSRVYIGVHYPLDIFVGALIGFLIGMLIANLYKKLPEKYHFQSINSQAVR